MAKITNDYLIVDADKRTITVPETEKFFGVFSDRNVERKYFKCPKIVGDNVDLSTCEMFINYVSVGDTAGQYHCTDIAVVGEEITFSWLLSGNVFDTNKTGNIYFAVQAKTASGENVFNTTKAIGSVSETVQAIDYKEERYVDVILELLTRVDTLEKNGGGSGGGSYVLPKATSNALGGVKADNKGTEYTVPVKIGGDNKLYVPTYPSYDEAILNIDFERDLGLSLEEYGLDGTFPNYQKWVSASISQELNNTLNSFGGTICLTLGVDKVYLTKKTEYRPGHNNQRVWGATFAKGVDGITSYSLTKWTNGSGQQNEVQWKRVKVNAS